MKKLHAQELSRNQSILRFDVILRHDWPIEQCFLHIRVFFGGKTKSTCFDLFINWLIRQITNTVWKHFSRSYENRSNQRLRSAGEVDQRSKRSYSNAVLCVSFMWQKVQMRVIRLRSVHFICCQWKSERMQTRLALRMHNFVACHKIAIYRL